MMKFKDFLAEGMNKAKMKYKTSKGKEIEIEYSYDNKIAYFKVPNREGTGMSDEISVKKDRLAKEFKPEVEISNYLITMNY